MKATLSSTDLATLLRINPRSVPRWARTHGVTPLRRQRVGRTTVTVWDIAALGAAARPRLTGGRHAGSNTP